MAEDERLREAILEMEIMRAREARMGQTNAALLACIESYSCAPTPDAALASLFSSLIDLVGADRSFLVTVPESEATAQVIASDDPTWIGMITKPPFNITTRPRNLSNLESAGPWRGALDLSGYASALIAPAKDRHGRQHALICLKTQPSFARTDQPILLRLSSLFVQAVQTQALNAENALLAATIQGSSSGFAIADARHRERPLIYVNAAFEQITGYTSQEVLGRNCRFLNADMPETPDREALRQTVRERRSGQFVVRNRKRSGELFWNELSIYPVQDADGMVTHLVATQTDVTDRIEANAARDQIKAQMQEALATADDAFLMLEPDGSVRYANSATRTLFPAENVGWRAGTDFADNWSDYLDQMRRTHGRVTQFLEDADLDRLYANPSGTPLNLPDGRTVLVRLHRLVDGVSVIWGTDLTANAARLG